MAVCLSFLFTQPTLINWNWLHLQDIIGNFVDQDVAGHNVSTVVEGGEQKIDAAVVVQVIDEHIECLTHRVVDDSHLNLQYISKQAVGQCRGRISGSSLNLRFQDWSSLRRLRCGCSRWPSSSATTPPSGSSPCPLRSIAIEGWRSWRRGRLCKSRAGSIHPRPHRDFPSRRRIVPCWLYSSSV